MEKTGEKTLVDKTFEDLLPAYEKDAKITYKKGLEHGISQVNILRSMTMDLSFKSDFDLGEEDLTEKLKEMINLYLKGTPVKANRKKKRRKIKNRKSSSKRRIKKD